MNEQDPHTPGTEVGRPDPAGDPVRLDQGHVEGTGGLPERFTNPGLPTHVQRMADVDEKAADRAEKQVAALFGISIVGTLLFIVLYFAVDLRQTVFIPGVGTMNASHAALGVTLAFSLLGIGLGAVHWAKTLMPDHEVVEERHPMRASDEDRAEAVRVVTEEGGTSQISRRPLIKYTLGGALGLFALPLGIQVAGSLGEMPRASLSQTWWNGGPSGPHDEPEFTPLRLMKDPENVPILASDVTIGSVYHVMPEGLLPDPVTYEGGAEHLLEEKAKAAVLLMRLDPTVIRSQKELDWGFEGIVAYSKICTHVGCPVGLYEQQTHHLLCPCHQSTFDVTQDCKVIFGPAKRPLPQLPISVDDEGYLVSTAPFAEAVGPSFWERG
ncbi:Rieske (2Fe-2S) protein [Phycicoccus sp. BSK3Z-2]|uniref:Cytochrome bc1 complex Rieske iron-sulfur subunit n=1 Tax=Phycicoccus avicenniae TaxID=2828860 RepID=A0A941D7R3_9MICO|nr:Rieske 2Fe-2S domain-containing protein [Phycicoccus avicenniae]MBR7743161.1 Rieske (2Fe-2S) protein [Phycicoccus avicenniae]